MKRLLSILIIMIFILGSMFSFSNAADASVAVTVGGLTTIQEGTKTLELTIDLGSFYNFQEGKTLGYETTLSYNTDAIENVVVAPLNSWTADYNSTTKKMIGTVASGQANKSIAKITYTLKDNVAAGTDLKIEFKSFNITDDDVLDLTLNLNKPVTIKAKTTSTSTQQTSSSSSQSTTNTTNNTVTLSLNTNQINNNTTNNTVTNTNKAKDNTVTVKSTLPKTGVTKVIIPVIFTILLLGIASIIKSKSIKLK